ncbi:MAG: DUF4058 family protein [Isosphaeraceae bacterium]
MDLYDWSDRPGWEGMYHLWIAELLRWVKPRLPIGYRAYIGSAPLLAVGAPEGRPDVSVRDWPAEPSATAETPAARPTERPEFEPDVEIAVAALDPGTALFVERQGRLVAAVELISPHNKDRPIARTAYLSRYLGYLMEAVNLLLIDVHRRPLGFSFADRIAEELSFPQAHCPTPSAVSYRVGEPAAAGGRILAIWRRPLSVGSSMPVISLPLTVDLIVPIDLDQTYAMAASDAYLS